VSRLERQARFAHPQRLPLMRRGTGEAVPEPLLLAQVLGCTADEATALVDGLDARAAAAAEELTSDPKTRTALSRLPFRSGDRIVALGDSITADRVGWARLLSGVLAGSQPGVTVVNEGLGGDTSSDLIARLDLVSADRPSWVVLMIGTNDIRRHGPTRAYRMASISETRRNLGILARAVKEMGANLLVMTAPPVHEERAATYFRDDDCTWYSADAEELAETVLEVRPDAVDVHRAFTATGIDDLLEPDGVHPSIAGQQLIVRTLLSVLTARAGAPQP
jgi:lysophospholipase L1-like esterase